jgi:hypothetical protein
MPSASFTDILDEEPQLRMKNGKFVLLEVKFWLHLVYNWEVGGLGTYAK